MGNCEAVAAVVSASDKDSRTAGLYDTGDVKGDGRAFLNLYSSLYSHSDMSGVYARSLGW